MTYQEAVRKLQRELMARRYAQTTVNNYTQCFNAFWRNYHKYNGYKSTDDIKDFLIAEIKSRSYHKQMVATIHAFYKAIGKPISLKDLPYPRKSKFLPQVLSVNEVDKIITGTTNLKHRAILQLIYSCGLRISEATKVNVWDVDFDQRLLYIQSGKGAKSRFIPVPEDTLTLLYTYIQAYNVKNRLFEGQGGDYSTTSIQNIFRRAKTREGIRKPATVHSLRHSRATHLCDGGADVHDVKEFLGHTSIETTCIYLHLSKLSLSRRISRADDNLRCIADQRKNIVKSLICIDEKKLSTRI